LVKDDTMLVRIHYDGWLALPSLARRQLGLNTGDQLEVVATAEGILLRRSKPAAAAEPAAPAVAEPQAQPLTSAIAARRSKPRPIRKGLAGAGLAPTLKARGKRSKSDVAPSTHQS
jgi:bifunctional DNA-binding transcriptional regulator/antitoxin component of YhaV-PrlF toxin-antitoxin module